VVTNLTDKLHTPAIYMLVLWETSSREELT
jgi:hypothetical protein